MDTLTKIAMRGVSAGRVARVSPRVTPRGPQTAWEAGRRGASQVPPGSPPPRGEYVGTRPSVKESPEARSNRWRVNRAKPGSEIEIPANEINVQPVRPDSNSWGAGTVAGLALPFAIGAFANHTNRDRIRLR